MDTQKRAIVLKVYGGFAAGLAIVLSFVSIFSKSTDRNASFLGYSAPRIILIIILLAITISITTLAVRLFVSSKFLRRVVNWIDWIANKPNLFLFTKDILFLSGLAAFALLFFRKKYFGFLEFVWKPLPNYVSAFEPYLTGVIIFTVISIGFLGYTSALLRGADIKREVGRSVKKIAIFVVIYASAALIYWGSSALVGRTSTPSYSYFPNLAEAFYNHQLYLSNFSGTKDLTLFNGEYYVSFPPLGALLMFPKVASTSRFGINTVRFTIGFSALTPAVLYLIYEKLKERKLITLNTGSAIWLVLLFGLGTSQWYLSTTGVIVHTAQLLAAAFQSLAILSIFLWKGDLGWGLIRSALLSGGALGLAILSRPHIGFSWFFILGLVIHLLRDNMQFTIKTFLLWASISTLPMAVFVVGQGYYNYARFGSALDFGYAYMLVAERLSAPLQTYGQFHPHYIWQNIMANWLGLPYWHDECARLAPNRAGMSIFLTTPALAFLYRSWKKEIWLIGGWISTGLIALVHLLYYNTGGHQFGYRFSLDFMVIAFCLLAAAFKERLPKFFKLLVFYSLAINFIGVLWNAKQWCITW